jgi:Ribosomal protein S14p/S29e
MHDDDIRLRTLWHTASVACIVVRVQRACVTTAPSLTCLSQVPFETEWDLQTSGTHTRRSMARAAAAGASTDSLLLCSLLPAVQLSPVHTRLGCSPSCSLVRLYSKVCGNQKGIVRKYELNVCRQCFREYAKDIGFVKVRALVDTHDTREPSAGVAPPGTGGSAPRRRGPRRPQLGPETLGHEDHAGNKHTH